jgi:hypothetical protein
MEVRMKKMSLVAVLALAALTPSSAHAANSNNCKAAGKSGSKVLAQSRYAVVYRKTDVTRGCIYSTGRGRTLGRSGNVAIGGVQLAGRYVAYVADPTTNDQAPETLRVLDLKTGRTAASATATSFASLVLKRNATIAWIGVYPASQGSGNDLQVHKRETKGANQDVVLDRGRDIVGQSLALSYSSTVLFWTNGADAKRAAIQ